MNYDVIIIGAGIVGLSTALQLLQRDSQLKVAVLDKEATSAVHQTGHNSGVIHAGVYYKPGSLKAQFCIEGCKAIKEFCQQHGIEHKEVGKIIAAITPEELPGLNDLAVRCQQNGLTVEMLTAAEARQRQPGLESISAFFVRETGIVNYKQICQKYAELFQQLGGSIYYQQEICQIHESENFVTLKTKQQTYYRSQYLITCAGLYSDRLIRMLGLPCNYKIIPFRGEYYRLVDRYNSYFNHAIYPVPNPKLPFLGVHFTPQIGGFTTVGPNAVLALAREGYRWRDINIKDLLEIVSFKPMWKMIKNHWEATCDEIRGSISMNYYLKLIRAYFPDIKKSDLYRYPAGVRAQAVDQEGNLVNDFLFTESRRTLHTCNAPSPAATSSLPIGRYIVDKLYQKFNHHSF